MKAAGDLLQEELNDIWDAAPKFPDVDSQSPERIDVDSFIEIYRDIDDIFEDEDDVDGNKSAEELNNNKSDDIQNEGDEQELKVEFYSICNSKGFITKADLKKWRDIQDLFKENMLDEAEFDAMWLKASKSSDLLDLDGFLAFNAELDELFVFDDDDDDSIDDDGNKEEQLQMFYGDDLPAGVIFSELADDDFLIGMNELKRWGDLQDMLSSGDLLPIELQNMFEQIPKAPGTNDKLNEEGFENLFEAIDALFEDDEVEGSETYDDENDLSMNLKSDLLEAISSFSKDDDKMPCGLESTDESEVQEILNIVAELESQSSNLVLSSGGDLVPADVAGNWELLYTTSSTMKFNKGLSGLVPPNGKFGGLKQTLKASKYLADVEYIEQINAGPASFEVRVTGKFIIFCFLLFWFIVIYHMLSQTLQTYFR